MADEKNSKKAKAPFIKRVGMWFKRLPKRIATPFKNMWHELKKVTWPTKKDLFSYTMVVIAFMVFMAVVIGVIDLGASSLIHEMINTNQGV